MAWTAKLGATVLADPVSREQASWWTPAGRM